MLRVLGKKKTNYIIMKLVMSNGSPSPRPPPTSTAKVDDMTEVDNDVMMFGMAGGR